MYNHLNDTVTKLDNIVANLDAGKGSAGKLLKDDSLYNNLNSSWRTRTRCSPRPTPARAAGPDRQGPRLRQEAERHRHAARYAAGQRQRRQGHPGPAGTNNDAYNNLDRLLVTTNDLVTAVRQDPRSTW